MKKRILLIGTGGTIACKTTEKGLTPAITSGESGAAPFGALSVLMTSDDCADVRKELGLDETANVLVFSTEGDTDPQRYKNIVWKGLDK